MKSSGSGGGGPGGAGAKGGGASYVPPHRRRNNSNNNNNSGDYKSGGGGTAGTVTASRSSASTTSSSGSRTTTGGGDGGGSTIMDRIRQRTPEPKQRQQAQKQQRPPRNYGAWREEEPSLLLPRTFTFVCCINLDHRFDRWDDFVKRLERLSRTASNSNRNNDSAISTRNKHTNFAVQRVSAVDGKAVVRMLEEGGNHRDEEISELLHLDGLLRQYATVDDVLAKLVPARHWDATRNAKWDKHVRPPFENKTLTPGEIGCAMSHAKLWMEFARGYNNSNGAPNASASKDEKDEREEGEGATEKRKCRTMLILEDDADFYRRDRGRLTPTGPGTSKSASSGIVGFDDVFRDLWNRVPEDWDILYLGLSDRGERLFVGQESKEETEKGEAGGGADDDGGGDDENRRINNEEPLVRIFRPTYGFHTHAYAITDRAAAILVEHLPVVGPLDVWLADNNWFGMNVYVGVVANDGWNNQGAQLVFQARRGSAKKSNSDIDQSGRFD